LNRATLLGRVGADPEVRNTNGGKVANLRVATTERWRTKDGERKEKTEWHSIVVWGDGMAGIIEKFVSKGDQILLEGKIETRKWQDKDGNDRYSTEIVLSGMDGKIELLGGKKEGGSSDGGSSSSRSSNDAGRSQRDIDDEIAF